MVSLLVLVGLVVAWVMIFDLKREMKTLRLRLQSLETRQQERSASKVQAKQAAASTAVPGEPAPRPVAPLEMDTAPLVLDDAELALPDEVPTPSKSVDPQPDPWLSATPNLTSQPTRREPQPGSGARLWGAIRNFFTTGNVVVRIGMLVLFFGVAFLLKYAADHSTLSIELRLVGVALAALAVFGTGWWLRERRPGYALIMQGGGIGILYLTVFASAKLYQLLPLGMVFAVMGGLVVVSGLLAVVQNARSLALFGAAGGFLAPILTSTGSGSHIMLFSYYALLNLGIFGIAWFRAWRSLNLLGFLFTFVIGAAWGASYYRPHHFDTTEPFLILFFLFYVAIAVLYALRQPPNIKGFVDASLVFGVPLTAAGLQAAMVHRMEYGMAFSALAAGGFYIVLAALLWRRQGEGLRLMVESFLALGVGFLTLAIPLALDDRLISVAWGLEGAAMLWIGARQGRLLPRIVAIALQIAAGVVFALFVSSRHGALPFLNADFMGGVLLAIAGLFSAYTLNHHRETLRSWEPPLGLVMLLWGLLWWLGSGGQEVERVIAYHHQAAGMLGYLLLSGWLVRLLYLRLDWPAIRYAVLGYLPLLVLVLVGINLDRTLHPLAHWGWLVWPLALLTLYRLLADLEVVWPTALARSWHLGGLWLVMALLTLEGAWWVGEWLPMVTTWKMSLYGLLPALLVLALLRWGERLPWPVAGWLDDYLGSGIALLAIGLAGWLVWMMQFDGNPLPLDYLPLLNPLELTQALVLLALVTWLLRLRADRIPVWGSEQPLKVMAVLLAGLAFLWLNTLVARAVHYWGGVRYDFDRLFAADPFQSAIAILWTFTAMSCMVFASRQRLRGPWMAGAVLLAAVVVKLFLLDLAESGPVSRIVSFIGVGGLMLVIGYFSPLPPRSQPAGETA